jgi:DNA-binding GntR family transcriptional regulator
MGGVMARTVAVEKEYLEEVEGLLFLIEKANEEQAEGLMKQHLKMAVLAGLEINNNYEHGRNIECR